MKAYKNHTLVEYVQALSRREPVPGGGSVAALSGALGAGLIVMVARYSVGKIGTVVGERKLQSVIATAESLSVQFLEMVDEDAKLYLAFSRIPKTLSREKARAEREIRKIPQAVCRLARRALELTPFLVLHGNPFLIGDVEIAVEQLWSAWRSAAILSQLEPRS